MPREKEPSFDPNIHSKLPGFVKKDVINYESERSYEDAFKENFNVEMDRIKNDINNLNKEIKDAPLDVQKSVVSATTFARDMLQYRPKDYVETAQEALKEAHGVIEDWHAGRKFAKHLSYTYHSSRGDKKWE